MTKTVFILDAGFSMSAGAPSQEKLVEKIFEIHNSNPYIFKAGSVDRFEEFLTQTLNIPCRFLRMLTHHS